MSRQVRVLIVNKLKGNFGDNMLFQFNPKFHEYDYIPDLGSVVLVGRIQP